MTIMSNENQADTAMAATHAGNSKNNIVAESELQSALKGIENRLGEIQSANGWNKIKNNESATAASTGDNTNVDTTDPNKENGNDAGVENNANDEQNLVMNAETQASLNELLSQAEQSLPEHIRRIVQPVSDEEFHAHVRRNQTDQDDDGDDDIDDASMSDSSEEEESDEEVYDEDELIDHAAVVRARQLRSQVRETADRVQKLRDSATNRAISLARQEVELEVTKVGDQSTATEKFDPSEFEAKFHTALLDPTTATTKNLKLQEMEKTLQALYSALEGMDIALPESMETLQETIETIEKSIRKDAEGQIMSQTERAIISRDNEGNSSSGGGVLSQIEDTQEEKKEIPAEKRLASFLGQS